MLLMSVEPWVNLRIMGSRCMLHQVLILALQSLNQLVQDSPGILNPGHVADKNHDLRDRCSGRQQLCSQGQVQW